MKGEEKISGFVSMFSVRIEHEEDLKNNLNMNEKDQENMSRLTSLPVTLCPPSLSHSPGTMADR